MVPTALDALREYWAAWVQCTAVGEGRHERHRFSFCAGTSGHDGPHSWERA